MRNTRLPLLLLLPLTLGACLERAEPTVEQSVRPVQAVRVAAATESAPRHYPGLIRPRHEADLGFRTDGRIVAREVDVGARVAAGQVIARLDEADLALGVRAAEADLASAEAQAAMTASEATRSRTLATQGWAAAATDEQSRPPPAPPRNARRPPAPPSTSRATGWAMPSCARLPTAWSPPCSPTAAPWWPRASRWCVWPAPTRWKWR